MWRRPDVKRAIRLNALQTPKSRSGQTMAKHCQGIKRAENKVKQAGRAKIEEKDTELANEKGAGRSLAEVRCAEDAKIAQAKAGRERKTLDRVACL